MTSLAAQPPRPTLGTWLLALRPKTLSAAVAPVAVGTALSFAAGSWRPGVALVTLLCAVLIQIGTNLTNDYFDFKKGADTEERLGPQRVTQSGLIAPGTVFAGALTTFGLAFLIGLSLIWIGGWPIAVIGVASLLAGYAYTGGPFPLAYNGLGDVFVLVFFGPVAVCGTVWLQAGAIGPAAWIASLAMGASGTAILVVNNLRDATTDAKANKRTLIVRFGERAGRAEYVLTLLISFAVPIVLWALALSGAWVMLPLLALPLCVPPLRRVLHDQGRALNPALGETARFQMVFSLLLALGIALGA
ncbi:MAG TPA: 1,4-dihydroxy-2-naphthoate polyprenyltransferase [Myxococcaceae bacterium]|nr:1,4-dihydroxy-2-naphthoate polyprenyltransferase [Myxococcaceae bacterium]